MTDNFSIKAPCLQCRRIVLGEDAGWDEIEGAFGSADVCSLRQAWLPRQEAGLRPTSVRVGWDGTDLLILADLADDDPFNAITVYNEPSFMHGDVFEIFLRPVNQDPYYEFHVTPANQTFQLRFPSAKAFAEGCRQGTQASWKIVSPVMRSRTRVLAADKRWLAMTRIPVIQVGEQGPTRAGSHWLFSFSRYDYTRGIPKPVLSSSSPHSVCSFHRQEEWGTLVFE